MNIILENPFFIYGISKYIDDKRKIVAMVA
jgi:hypothetical protein